MYVLMTADGRYVSDFGDNGLLLVTETLDGTSTPDGDVNNAALIFQTRDVAEQVLRRYMNTPLLPGARHATLHVALLRRSFLIDYRCPNCNRPVDRKREDVRILRTFPVGPPVECAYCRVRILLVRGRDEGLGEEYYFTDGN